MTTRTRNDRRRTATAYHEAGHAVAAIHAGITVQLITIKPKGDVLGYCKHARMFSKIERELFVFDDHNPRIRRRLEESILIGLAGPAAERRLRGRANHRTAVGDYRHLGGIALTLWGDPELAGPYLVWLTIRADAFMKCDTIWWQVEAIAAALLEREMLRRDEVKTIWLDSIQRGMEKQRETR